MKYFIIFICIIYGCSNTKSMLYKEITASNFKDRTLCNCIALGLDSNRNSNLKNQVIPYNPIAIALYDSVINENLKPIIEKMYSDSIQKNFKFSKAFGNRKVFNNCIEFYKSKELNEIALKNIKRIRMIKNLEEFISLKYPTW